MGTYIDVVDTAILCGLDIKQNTLDKVEVQARCPYCNDYKYRMYLSRNPDNPTFFCHNCGHRGNAVILFADFNPMLQPMTTQEAYRYLINNPNIHTQANPYFYSPPSLRIRPLWERNIIYMEFLKLLNLEFAHRENLLRRGMSDAIITGSLYKSFPVDPEFRQWVADVLASRFDLTDMLGFYTQNNRWHIAKYGSGILTPVCTADNQIQGLQIRYDTVPIHRHLQADGSLKEKRGCRFGWFSSGGGNYQNGTGIKGYMHVVGNGNSDTVFLTEGVMKSDIASYLSGGSLFVGLTGVNNTRFLAEVIGMLRPRIIVECIDMDKRYNPHVMKAMENIRAICIPLCQNYQPFDWPDRFKGIDDYYLAQRMQQDKAA